MCYHRSLIDRFIYVGIWILAAMMFAIPASAAEDIWLLESWAKPFDYRSASSEIRYEPLPSAA